MEKSKKPDVFSPKNRLVGEHPVNVENAEVQEVTAQISVPHDGGWGWVVVFSAFVSIFILDGVAYTFGSIHNNMAKDLNSSEAAVALINSTAVALYLLVSPLASALINRFGFRACAMSGSVICSFSLFTSYFAKKYSYVFIFYGLCAGFGYGLINMASSLVVGFYFEKLRSVALAIATCGSSLGVMILFPLNSYLVKLDGWRPTTLLHSGLFGTIFFLSMAYTPLLSVTITKTEDETMRTLAYLPSVMSTATTTTITPTGKPFTPTGTERLFSAVSNYHFPMAAAVVEADRKETETKTASQPGPSTAADTTAKKSKITVTARKTDGTQEQLKRVQSKISTAPTADMIVKQDIEPKKKGFWRRLFHWEPHAHESRPLYRDDAFYEGEVKNLPHYQKSVADTTEEQRTGLEYQIAVTRATGATDLSEKHGVFTTAIRRVLATMMDPSILKKSSFLLMCSSGFLTYLGFLVPYVYLQERNLKAGIDPNHCALFMSAIGLSNAFGRLILGSLATKLDPLKLFAFSCFMAGVSTIASTVSYNVYYQYLYCCVFGFSIASVACLRSLILVSLYGLDKLTNATGMMLMFLGIGNLGSTPLAGVIISHYGYPTAFYVSGGFMAISGLVLIPVKFFAVREMKKQEQDQIEAARKEQQQRRTTPTIQQNQTQQTRTTPTTQQNQKQQLKTNEMHKK